MNKFIFILLFFAQQTYAISNMGGVAVSFAAANAAHQTRINNELINAQQKRLVRNNQIKGVMTCSASYSDIPESRAWDYYGCKGFSIQEFFKKYKRDKKYQILQVYYNEHANEFMIYYG
jgi:hypothetical protein